MELFDFQDKDITYLEDQPSALVVWDPGLGKTYGSLERDRRIRGGLGHAPWLAQKAWPTLIIAPLYTHDAWEAWIREVYPTPRVIRFSDDRDLALTMLMSKVPGFYLLHWELLRESSDSRKKAKCKNCKDNVIRQSLNHDWVHKDGQTHRCAVATGTNFLFPASIAEPNLRENWAGDTLRPVLQRTKFLHVIADEAHRMKNKNSQQAKGLKKIPTEYRTALTGTPITNMPPDLYSILNWLDKPNFKNYENFYLRYSLFTTMYGGAGGGTSYRQYVGPKNVAELQGRIAPFTVQRRKEDVLRDLPDRYYTTIRVDLGSRQRRAYDSMRKHMVAWIGESDDTPLVATVAIAKLQRLQQLAIAFATISDDPAGRVQLAEPSAKLDVVMELLEDNPEEQFVIFSQFKGATRLLGTRLSDAGIPHGLFHGDVEDDQRRCELDRFKSGDSRIFVATIGAGGEGIDGLQRASRVIFLDRSWSPAQNDQSESRLHRIGQANAVQVIDIVANSTVDREKGIKLELKKSWIKEILGE